MIHDSALNLLPKMQLVAEKKEVKFSMCSLHLFEHMFVILAFSFDSKSSGSSLSQLNFGDGQAI